MRFTEQLSLLLVQCCQALCWRLRLRSVHGAHRHDGMYRGEELPGRGLRGLLGGRCRAASYIGACLSSAWGLVLEELQLYMATALFLIVTVLLL